MTKLASSSAKSSVRQARAPKSPKVSLAKGEQAVEQTPAPAQEQAPIIAEQVAPEQTPAPAIEPKVEQAPAQKTGIELARQNVQAKATDGIGVTLHTNGKPIKGLSAEAVVARPQRKMLRVIDKIIGHPGKGNCVKRFHLYREGMTLLDCKVTPGLIPSDVTFYAELGYLTLREATDAEYEAAVKAWEQSKASAASTQAA